VLLEHIALKQLWMMILVNSWALMLWEDVIELLWVELLPFLLLI